MKAASARATRVLIVAPSAARRHALRALLDHQLDLEIVDAAAAEMPTSFRRSQPGVVVIDVDGDLSEAAGPILDSGASVVALAESPDAAAISQFLAAGRGAVLRRDCNEQQIAAAVQAVAAGLAVLEPESLLALLRPPLETVELEPGEEELTPRETEVLRMMTEGLSNREIASALGISEHTVKFHITSIFGKLGTSSRTEAVTEGIRRGLILL
ncbi:MAG TPA: response regulator transcription factor [Terriglobales bacterium]|nr:response regulator transcription factor [Terriglobales bacterium]